MSDQAKPPVSKPVFLKAMAELEQLDIELKQKTERRDKIRRTMAELFHQGEAGTENHEVYGYEVKVVRKLNITCDKDAKAQLAADKPDLFKIIFPKKVTTDMNPTKAKEHLDQIEDYVTTKQGLPVVTFKRIS
jgi:hypothetical protein